MLHGATQANFQHYFNLSDADIDAVIAYLGHVTGTPAH
jgi:hypothetical protein